MANAVYPLAKQKIALAQIDWEDDTFKIVLLDTNHSYNAAHEFLDDINTNAVATSSALANCSADVNGANLEWQADDPTYSALTGSTCEAWVLFKDSGVASTSPIIYHADTRADTTAYSYTPNGSDYTLQFGSAGVLQF